MSTEQLNKFLKITNNKEIINILINKSDEEISDIYSILEKIHTYLNEAEQIILIDKYLSTERNLKIRNFITNVDVLSNRTCDEILRLIIKYLELNNDSNIYEIISNKTMLATRTIDEQLSLIDIYERETQFFVLILVKDSNILQNYSYEEQMSLIDIYLSSNKDTNVYGIIISENLIDVTYENKINLIDKYLSTERDTEVYNIMISKDDYENKLRRIDDYLNERGSKKYILTAVKELKDLRTVIDVLRKNEVQEFDGTTKIYTYIGKTNKTAN